MEPAEADRLVEEADQLLDANEFAAARDLYRKAGLQAPPTEHLLFNLRVAEEQEQLQFARELTNKHPDLLLAQLAQVFTFMEMGGHWNAHAVHICTECLQAGELSPIEILRIRGLRFRAALRYSPAKPYPDELIEGDFEHIWELSRSNALIARKRSNILVEIAGVKDTEAIPLLERLAAKEWLQSSHREFIKAKIAELELLRQLTNGTV